MTAKELYDKITNDETYKTITNLIDQKRKEVLQLNQDLRQLYVQESELIKPVLNACVQEAGTRFCPEVFSNGYCDDCPCEDFCPSSKQDWTA